MAEVKTVGTIIEQVQLHNEDALGKSRVVDFNGVLVPTAILESPKYRSELSKSFYLGAGLPRLFRPSFRSKEEKRTFEQIKRLENSSTVGLLFNQLISGLTLGILGERIDPDIARLRGGFIFKELNIPGLNTVAKFLLPHGLSIASLAELTGFGVGAIATSFLVGSLGIPLLAGAPRFGRWWATLTPGRQLFAQRVTTDVILGIGLETGALVDEKKLLDEEFEASDIGGVLARGAALGALFTGIEYGGRSVWTKVRGFGKKSFQGFGRVDSIGPRIPGKDSALKEGAIHGPLIEGSRGTRGVLVNQGAVDSIQKRAFVEAIAERKAVPKRLAKEITEKTVAEDAVRTISNITETARAEKEGLARLISDLPEVRKTVDRANLETLFRSPEFRDLFISDRNLISELRESSAAALRSIGFSREGLGGIQKLIQFPSLIKKLEDSGIPAFKDVAELVKAHAKEQLTLSEIKKQDIAAIFSKPEAREFISSKKAEITRIAERVQSVPELSAALSSADPKSAFSRLNKQYARLTGRDLITDIATRQIDTLPTDTLNQLLGDKQFAKFFAFMEKALAKDPKLGEALQKFRQLGDFPDRISKLLTGLTPEEQTFFKNEIFTPFAARIRQNVTFGGKKGSEDITSALLQQSNNPVEDIIQGFENFRKRTGEEDFAAFEKIAKFFNGDIEPQRAISITRSLVKTYSRMPDTKSGFFRREKLDMIDRWYEAIVRPDEKGLGAGTKRKELSSTIKARVVGAPKYEADKDMILDGFELLGQARQETADQFLLHRASVDIRSENRMFEQAFEPILKLFPAFKEGKVKRIGKRVDSFFEWLETEVRAGERLKRTTKDVSRTARRRELADTTGIVGPDKSNVIKSAASTQDAISRELKFPVDKVHPFYQQTQSLIEGIESFDADVIRQQIKSKTRSNTLEKSLKNFSKTNDALGLPFTLKVGDDLIFYDGTKARVSRIARFGEGQTDALVEVTLPNGKVESLQAAEAQILHTLSRGGASNPAEEILRLRDLLDNGKFSEGEPFGFTKSLAKKPK